MAKRIGKYKVTKRDSALSLIDGGTTAGVINFASGNLTQTLSETDKDARNISISAAEFKAGIIVHTSQTGGGTITIDTAANLISGLGLTADNQCATCILVNDGDQTVTMSGSVTGISYADTGATILENGSAILMARRLTATTVKMYIIGGA